jgi:hypothetical protein
LREKIFSLKILLTNNLIPSEYYRWGTTTIIEGASALPFSQKTKRKRINKRKIKSAKPFDYKTISKLLF